MTGDSKGRLRDERDWIALPGEIKEADRINGLQSTRDLLDALATVSPDARDREIYVRRRLWWASNDHQRLRSDGTPTVSQPAVAAADAHTNIVRLLVLFENDLSAQIERGELLRQLGRFDEAVGALKAIKRDGHSEVRAIKIQRLAQARDTALALL